MRLRTKEVSKFVRTDYIPMYYVPWKDLWSEGTPGEWSHRNSFRRDLIIDEEPTGQGGPYPERMVYHEKLEMDCGNSGLITQIDPWYGYHGRGSTPAFWECPTSAPPLPSPTWSDEWPDVTAELLESLDPSQEVIQGLPFIGEMSSTKRMIMKPHSFLKKLHVPRGMKQRPIGEVLTKLRLDRASSGWLAYAYGWDPLFGDLAKAFDLVNSTSYLYDEYQKGSGWRKARLSRKFNEVEVLEGNPSIDQTCVVHSERVTTTLEYRIIPAEGTSRSLSKINFIAKKMGLSPSNILTAAWELRPYSFVADWVYPVGDLLSGLKAAPCNIEVRKASLHHTRVSEFEITRAPVQGTVGGKSSTPYCIALQGKRELYRRNWPGMNPGSGLSGHMSTKRVISALSLIAQRLVTPIRK